MIPPTPAATAAKMQEKPKPVYAETGQARVQALRIVWPIVCRRLEEFPNINATQLFEELCVQFPGRFTRKQYKTLVRRVNLWRQAARARGVVVGPKTYRRLNDKPLAANSIGSFPQHNQGAPSSLLIERWALTGLPVPRLRVAVQDADCGLFVIPRRGDELLQDPLVVAAA
ncbi:hypothetical protein X743_30250 [Mesorhizobium sp. LNHC252B00]|nr:hypothetical protein X743_30250 [Mesorhizobium sp. LNHC252B00]